MDDPRPHALFESVAARLAAEYGPPDAGAIGDSLRWQVNRVSESTERRASFYLNPTRRHEGGLFAFFCRCHHANTGPKFLDIRRPEQVPELLQVIEGCLGYRPDRPDRPAEADRPDA
jgi:hypothetical protein